MQYTKSELKKLSDIENHKIIYDGYDYWWYSVKDKEFTLHCIIPFNDYKTLLINIKVWIRKYHKLSIGIDCVELMIQDLLLDVKIKNIAKDNNIKTNNKIKQILVLKPNVKNKELCSLLRITKMAISKQLKSINQLC